MKVFYSDQSLKSIKSPSIFLAGPTPRSDHIKSWRPEALDILNELNFEWDVLIPERQDLNIKFNYIDQVEWEYYGLEHCTLIIFWIPRNLKTLPAFTTNIEFGRYVGSKRIIYGRPNNTPKIDYLDWIYKKLEQRTPCTSLRETLNLANSIIKRRK